jgi:RimJ/RimL family protein N-acetyltransferase
MYWTTFPDGFPGLEGDERNHLLAVVHPANIASVKVLRKCGFEFWKNWEVDDWNTGERIVLHRYKLQRPGTESV